ncbi:hypothetical protein A2690_01215 [Candidatus Roizmanbacteria bacterium RIFCSPHIGHO2_01_FULL_39_12b]|uniref:Soluble ligand binding domain-containing protein n=1 Tax=Candidatus Roizmanbacteria bacterium RIFCSPHIGHO2_01_FULL_39_12b TaxID=1802030 RepID=A0A1F7G9C9_9BACT|nr:MAG: hypothetical protein A2690_01215 [Candidatus Roizmanbacteria bacterium RIFCSPHIGHO2_01_FULL_39_12b]OGK45984.1 MAG: hypothetical protein A3B46_00980 [Candidatus Roizmanbacteria bacterium RIFCSPLOWO2_01_FULL_39_19]
MERQGERISKIIDFLKTVGKTEAIFLSLSVIFLLLSLAIFVSSSSLLSKKDDIVVAKSSDNEKIFIDVGGAVERPGVYQMTEGSRVKDALISANGISASADRDFVARTINGARTLIDGEKIFIPEFIASSQASTVASGRSVLGTTNNIVNINTSSNSQLDNLPGVGEKTIEKIIAGRPYQNILELREKKIVGKAVFEKIKDLISIY